MERIPKNLNNKKLSDIEQMGYSLRYILRKTALVRELDISAVKERILLSLLPTLFPIDKYLEELEECEKIFLNHGMSNADIIIRCSTECCWLYVNNSTVFLPMMDYESLLYFFLILLIIYRENF